MFTENPAGADFLFRYLSLPDGELADLDARAAARDLLLEPFGAPAEALSWIASLFGLALDERWSEAARRQLLAEVICLWRRRGTLGALTRMLEIYLGVRPVIIEAWRLRAIGGAGGGTGMGQVGGGLVAGDFAQYAHRFSVMIPRLLDEDQQQCVRDLLDLYRPAHTLLRPVHRRRWHARGTRAARRADLRRRAVRRVAPAPGRRDIPGHRRRPRPAAAGNQAGRLPARDRLED